RHRSSALQHACAKYRDSGSPPSPDAASHRYEPATPAAPVPTTRDDPKPQRYPLTTQSSGPCAAPPYQPSVPERRPPPTPATADAAPQPQNSSRSYRHDPQNSPAPTPHHPRHQSTEKRTHRFPPPHLTQH